MQSLWFYQNTTQTAAEEKGCVMNPGYWIIGLFLVGICCLLALTWWVVMEGSDDEDCEDSDDES